MGCRLIFGVKVRQKQIGCGSSPRPKELCILPSQKQNDFSKTLNRVNGGILFYLYKKSHL